MNDTAVNGSKKNRHSGIDVVHVVSRRRFGIGYEARREIWRLGDDPSSDLEMKSAYDLTGQYLGDWKMARFLCRKKGIRSFEKISEEHCVCSIGFNPREDKWYGWSHRAIFGFGVGDRVAKGDCTATSGWTQEWLDQHPDEDVALPIGFSAKTVGDAKRMAVAFASSVS